jgi:hypothetical protein
MLLDVMARDGLILGIYAPLPDASRCAWLQTGIPNAPWVTGWMRELLHTSINPTRIDRVSEQTCCFPPLNQAGPTEGRSELKRDMDGVTGQTCLIAFSRDD